MPALIAALVGLAAIGGAWSVMHRLSEPPGPSEPPGLPRRSTVAQDTPIESESPPLAKTAQPPLVIQPPASTHPGPSEAPTALVPGSVKTTAETLPHEDGWDTEVFSEAVDQQQKALAKLLLHPNELNAEALAKIAAEDVTSDELRPSGRSEVFRDRLFVVTRASRRVKPGGSPAPTQGLPELAAQLQSLVAPGGASTDLHAKFKTIRVEPRDDGVRTEAYFQIGGRTPEGSLQINATLECLWTSEPPSGGTGSASGTRPPRLKSLRVLDYEEITGLAKTGPMFADVTEAVLADNASFKEQLLPSIDQWTGMIEARWGIDIGGWQGLAVGDVNGDGLEDVYICQPGGLPNRLYVQRPDGSAIDRSREAGVDILESTHAALFADFDNDADQDLAISVMEGVVFFSNDGKGHFTPRLALPLPAAVPYSFAAADYDTDGDLDLFVCCYNARRIGSNRHVLFARPVPYYDAENGGANVLLRNDSTASRRVEPGGTPPPWRFTPATRQYGFHQNNNRFSYAACWDDYDDDGDLDLFVTNDFGRDNLYRNDGGYFRDVADDAGVADLGPGMSCCWGDYDNDGRMDLYVSNMFSSAGNRIAHNPKFHADADQTTLAAFRHHARGNSLFRNVGGGKFQDVSVDAHVAVGRWAWGSKFVDFNNDGWQDIVVSNGFITQENTGDL
jgi:hypothetical protein